MFRKLFHQLVTQVYLGVIKSKNGFDAMVLRQLQTTDAYKGSSVATFKVNEGMCDENDHLASGFSTTLVDTMTSTALSTIIFSKPHVTVTLNMEYYKPARKGDEVVITSGVVKLGKNLAFLQAMLRDKTTGDLLVKGTHIKFVLDKR